MLNPCNDCKKGVIIGSQQNNYLMMHQANSLNDAIPGILGHK